MGSQVFSVQENHILFPWGLFLRLSSNFPNPYFIEADTLFREFFHMYSKLFRFNYFLEQTRPSMGSQVFSLRANHFLFPWGLLEELIEPEKLLYRRTAILCGGCGGRKEPEDCSFFDRRSITKNDNVRIRFGISGHWIPKLDDASLLRH